MRKQTTSIPSSKRPNHIMLLAASLIAVTASGCSKSLPTDPMAGNDPASASAAASAPAIVRTPAESFETTSTWTWYTVASRWVNKGEAATVSGGRCKLQFARGSLSQGATVTIMERDPSIPDVLLGPGGTVLSKAATLTISYAGTTLEVAPTLLKLYRLNDATGAWEAVSGTNDLAARTFTAKVSLLCRYAISTNDPTKAGW